MSSGTNHFFVHPLLRARNWQHRPQLDAVSEWWRGGGRGVCGLIGMGGAGKTAIAERFLRILPCGLPEDPQIAKDSTLPTPRSVFVFSFYDAPNTDAFFRCLQMWLQNTAEVQSSWTVDQFMFQLQRTPGLIVLDGLERVQEDGQRGDFGRLGSPKLREFLDQLAAGNVPGLSALVTSRFPLSDLRDRREDFFHSISVDKIDVFSGIALLRDRGVKGTDVQLAPIVQHCGWHALTVDFTGGYISEYRNGDSGTPLNLGTPEELRAAEKVELDEDRRNVLHQGYRFARIADHYRDAMSAKDEAAMALLERICLFRLGTDIDVLARIFTGEHAVKVSGKALASLSRQQLQSKLDWLVKMQIVERSQEYSLNTENNRLKNLYTIHPAVRDGFLSGITGDVAVAGHDAVQKSLEVTLGEAPKTNPSDPATLDLLEEIVHHAFFAGQAEEAFMTYIDRIGGFNNLGSRLGLFERGERICRTFASVCFPDCKPLYGASRLSLPDEVIRFLLNSWGMYQGRLGRLDAAVRCFQHAAVGNVEAEHWSNASRSFQNICDARSLMGRLTGSAAEGSKTVFAAAAVAAALKYAEMADNDELRIFAVAVSGNVAILRGDVNSSLTALRDAIHLQHRISDTETPLWGVNALPFSRLFILLGRYSECFELTIANFQYSQLVLGTAETEVAHSCHLYLSDLKARQHCLELANELRATSKKWAEAHNAKDMICWSCLLEARELRHVEHSPAQDVGARNVIDSGLKIARDCGYGIYHIDLLLMRAHLHLVGGRVNEALDDIRVALDDGIPADEPTGQPELLAARHEACGYAWPVPEGLQLKAEALLLQAAQSVGSRYWKPCAECGERLTGRDSDRTTCHSCRNDDGQVGELAVAIEAESMDPGRINEWPAIRHLLRERFGQQLSNNELWERVVDLLRGEYELAPEEYFRLQLGEVVDLLRNDATSGIIRVRGTTQHVERHLERIGEASELVDEAEALLNEALERWQPLRDPEPERDDQNFKLNGKEYNYKAADTHRVLIDLEGGVLTRYPLDPLPESTKSETEPTNTRTEETKMPEFDVFLSHNSKDKPSVRTLKNKLEEDHGLKCWLDEEELPPGVPWQPLLEKGIRNSKSVAVLVGNDGEGPWQAEETMAALELAVREQLPVIPALLPSAPQKPDLPMFLANRGWVDLRGGLKKDDVDKLVWGVTGKKSNP